MPRCDTSGLTYGVPTRSERRRADLRAKQRDTRALSQLYAYVYRRDQYRCVACGTRVQPGGLDEFTRAHPHHIIPRSKASKAEKHTKQNVCTLCPLCHPLVKERKLFISGNAEKQLTIRWA